MENFGEIVYSEAHQNALAEFVSASEKHLNPQLEKIIDDVAKIGLTCYAWEHLKHLLSFKLSLVLDEHNARTPEPGFDEKKTQLLRHLNGFNEAPFTIQRLCELLVQPFLYATTSRFVFAVDKVLLVTTTQETLAPEAYNTQVQNLLASMGMIQAQNRSDAELNSTKSESEDGAFPPMESSLGAALSSFSPITTVSGLDTSASLDQPIAQSSSSADSMDVVDDRNQPTANDATASTGTDQQGSGAMEVDSGKQDSDAMDVDKPTL